MKKTLSLALITGISLTLFSLAGCTQTPVRSTQSNTTPTVTANTNNKNTVVVNEAKDNVNTETNINVSANVNDSNTNDNTKSDEKVAAVVDEGVVWLATPEKLDDLKLFQTDLGSTITYYKIADLEDGGELIYATEESMGTRVARFKKDATGEYSLLTQHSDYQNNSSNYTFADNVASDDTTRYAGLTYDDAMTVNDLTLTQVWPPFTYNEFFGVPAYKDDLDTYANPADGTIVTNFGATGVGPVYTVTSDIEVEESDGTTDLKLKKYILELADTSTVIYLDAKDFLADDGTIIGTFNDAGASFADRSFLKGLVANGCGFPNNGDQIVADMTVDRLTEIGTTDSGDKLYTLKNTTDALYSVAYSTYSLGRDTETAGTVSLEDFIAAQPVLVWQDATGAFVVFMDQTYAPNVECGKPVVYLYPTEPTVVNVQVGADVTVSEPNYGSGWTVTAQPNGQLTMANGTTYPNLFWEGKGHGSYPLIDRGRVVAANNIESELHGDLAKLGLNAQETADFLEFWLPKMPQTNYVRLTWLGTREMDTLAPLQISPKPDTTIRVFLDFAGQETAETNLRPQVLTHLPRRGFTVVEWGGVLR